MKGPADTCFQYLGYLGYRAIAQLATALSLGWCDRVGRAIGRVIWFFAVPYRRLVQRNLRLAFGSEKDEAEIRLITRRHFQTIARNFLISLKINSYTADEIEEFVGYENRELVVEASAAGKGVILAISHLGPWEVYTQLQSLVEKIPPATMYRPLSNRFINGHVVSHRSRIGVALFDRSTGVYGPMKHLRAGGGIGILIDQHAGDLGVWSPFFGRLASTSNLPALLSLRTGAPILSVVLLPDGPLKWKVSYLASHHPSAKPADFATEAARITHALNRDLEEAIRSAPQEWFWLHDRWKTPKPAFLLGQNKRGVFLPEAEAAGLKSFRILVRSPNPLGDACMAVPAVRAMKASRPDLHLTILCSELVAPVWRTVTEVDEVLTISRKASPLRTGRLIRRQAPFDAAILFPNSLRSAQEAWLGRIPRIVGYRGHHRKWLLDQIVPEPAPGPPRHHAHSYLRIAENTGADIAAEAEAVDHPRPPAATKPRPQGAPLHLGICPGAEYGAAKRWPEEKFADAVNQARQATNCRISLFGSPAERPIGEKLASLIDGECFNRVGSTTIEGLIEELKTCDALLTNDTGTMHLAALLGVPTIAVFGSTEPNWTRPLGAGHRVIRQHVECSPCFLRECPIDFRCMKAIDPASVAEAVVATLRDAGK